MDAARRELLLHIARRHGTPAYIYFLDEVRARARELTQALGGRFELSYAVKCNPNLALLRGLAGAVQRVDVSSGGELQRALRAGWRATDLSFSGPAKREPELRAAFEAGCGEIVCESLSDLRTLDSLAAQAGRRADVLLRINPARMPRRFGVNMAGKPSQFGIDEEDVDAILSQELPRLPNLTLQGFHVYSGTNCLDEEALAENFAIFIELFKRFARAHALTPARLIFGSGFGIPYFAGEKALDLPRLAGLLNPQIDQLRSEPRLAQARLSLELGRWLVGPAGYLLTGVIGEKRSRGTDIRLCDAGFNNHLSACGMMGTVIRRNWPIEPLGAPADAPAQRYMLVGPLCTTFDVLAQQIDLPPIRQGDVLAVGCSGAYGLSASPTRFISHPEPREIMVADGDRIEDVTEA